ncbi:MAG: hypothetical protein L3K16_04020 [Thermoplasmata archaeon]|nr:hypothetical protein [Thermoplasmata archaeon]
MRRLTQVLLLGLVAAGAVFGTLAVVGEQLVLGGQGQIQGANAWVNAQNAQWAQYCAQNGSQTIGCNGPPPLSSGIEQPQGQAGARELRFGQGLLTDSVAPLGVAFGLGAACAGARRGADRPPPVRPRSDGRS